jgi:hypothetical protein
MFDETEDVLEDEFLEDYTPLDVAAALMASGYDMNAYDGRSPLFDPYFED